MTEIDTPAAPQEPVAHPLARYLAESLAKRERPTRILLLGIGSGRSVPVLLNAGAHVEALEEHAQRAREARHRFAGDPRLRVTDGPYGGPYPIDGTFDAALSTHALLHGSPAAVAASIAALRERLAVGALLFTTLGSKSDRRFGAGTRIATDSFAPSDGAEAGVPHAYFDEDGVRALLRGFSLSALAENDASRSAGRWAHSEDEAAGTVHWFVRALRT